jgi:alpha-galactosidase
MKRCIAIFLFLAACTTAHVPVPVVKPAALVPEALPAAISLWPGGAPGSEGKSGGEIVTMRSDPATPYSPARVVPIVTHINNPSITPFLPDPLIATGIGLVIAPGGGHSHLSIQHEGYDIAKVLASHGIACFVLKYRLAKEPGSTYKIEVQSLMDAERAIRYVRAHAADWNLDPHRIGFLGLSAGGQLGLLASTTYERPVPPGVDAVDETSSRPDFVALLYPAGLNDPSSVKITAQTPATFLVDVHGDPRSRSVAEYFARLQAGGIPSEVHIYALGSEGFGVRLSSLPVATWPDRFMDWLREENLLNAAAPAATGPDFTSWAPTPPMGWNSYDAWGTTITEAELITNARFMEKNLLVHGWDTVVIDARWYDSDSPDDDRNFNKERTGARLEADEFGRLLPAPGRFPSAEKGDGFKALADRIHGMGLKFGIHIMRGIPRQTVAANCRIEGTPFVAKDAADRASTCSWCPDMFGVRDNPAGQAWYDSLFRQYAAWGVDFVKVDDLSSPFHAGEIQMIRRAIDRCGRAIVFSTSPGPTDPYYADQIGSLANMWRVSHDVWDRWSDVDQHFDLLANWQGAAGPGHWPDADMMPLGHIGIRCTIAGRDRQSRLTHDEQITLMTLWSIAPSPLILGNNLPDTDPWTLSLLTNDEVIAVNQDALGAGAKRVYQKDYVEVWVKPMRDGSKAVAVFNRGPSAAFVTWQTIGFVTGQSVRDLWVHQTNAPADDKSTFAIPAHGAKLYRF